MYLHEMGSFKHSCFKAKAISRIYLLDLLGKYNM